MQVHAFCYVDLHGSAQGHLEAVVAPNCCIPEASLLSIALNHIGPSNLGPGPIEPTARECDGPILTGVRLGLE